MEWYLWNRIQWAVWCSHPGATIDSPPNGTCPGDSGKWTVTLLDPTKWDKYVACGHPSPLLDPAMHSSSLRIAAATAAVLAIGLTAPQSAKACSMTGCGQSAYAALEGAAIPANTPAIPLLPHLDGAETQQDVVWTDSAGKAVPFELVKVAEQTWIKPLTGLVAGTTYQLIVPSTCSYGDKQPTETVSFVAGPIADYPVAAGVLALGPVETRPVLAWANAVCTATLEAASQTVLLQADPSLIPWLPLVSGRLQVGDLAWASMLTGYVTKKGPTLPTYWKLSDRTPYHIFAACGEVSPQADRGAALGTQTVTLELVLPPGLPALSASASTTLQCNTAGADAIGGPDVVSTPQGGPPLSPDSGCTAGQAGQPAGLAGMLALMALVSRRRRRAHGSM
jgi:MYXO-CTERM domain-containing protein